MNFTNGNGNKAQFSKYYKIIYVYKSKQNGIQKKKILTEMSTTTIKRILIIRLKLTKMPITTTATTTNNQNMKNTSLNTRTKNKN